MTCKTKNVSRGLHRCTLQTYPCVKWKMLGGFAVYLALFLLSINANPSTGQASDLGNTKRRIPWDQSQVVGFPDPPLPYHVEPWAGSPEFAHPLNVSALPGTRDLLVHVHGGGYGGPGKLLRINQDHPSQNAEEFLHVNEIIYGVAFHPDFETNGFMFVGCNGKSENLDKICTRVLRFQVDRKPPYHCDPTSETVIIEWPSNGHNGGDLAFGADGMLYVSAGDGTSDSDAKHAGQDLSTLPGSMLRIDVDRPSQGRLYGIPTDNPFLGFEGARPEIWAYGLRNPWRISFDRLTGDLWAGINGQDLWETVQVVRRGENYGWSITEGSHPFQSQRKRGPTPIVEPTIEHPHSEARSITGGHVYSGLKFPSLRGHYIYGDYSTGTLWAAKYRDEKLVSHFKVARTSLQITGFGIDHDGEILIVDYGGRLFRLIRNDHKNTTDFPRLLSETGIYVSVKDHEVHPGVIPYQVNSPFWSDGAEKQRYIGIPDGGTIPFKASGSWEFPEGTVLVKTFSLPVDDGSQVAVLKPQLRRVETRLMTKQDGEWFGYSYRWNEDQTDAELIPEEGLDEVFRVVNGQPSSRIREQTWHYPSRSECMVCHSRASNYVLGLSVKQTNRSIESDGDCVAQLEYFRQIGLFQSQEEASSDGNASELAFEFPTPIEELPKLVNPYEEMGSLEDRARSYLHANCANCHVKEGGGNSKIILSSQRPLDKSMLVGHEPMHDSFGLNEAKLIKPGVPDESILVYRLSRRGAGQMPPLSTNVVDDRGLVLIKRWIEAMSVESSDQSAESNLAE